MLFITNLSKDNYKIQFCNVANLRIKARNIFVISNWRPVAGTKWYRVSGIRKLECGMRKIKKKLRA